MRPGKSLGLGQPSRMGIEVDPCPRKENERFACGIVQMVYELTSKPLFDMIGDK